MIGFVLVLFGWSWFLSGLLRLLSDWAWHEWTLIKRAAHYIFWSWSSLGPLNGYLAFEFYLSLLVLSVCLVAS